jgi:hypothetical protein
MDTPNRIDCEQCIVISALAYRVAMLENKAAERRRYGHHRIAKTIEKDVRAIARVMDKLDSNHTTHREAY